jgi:hypothetical protein
LIPIDDVAAIAVAFASRPRARASRQRRGRPARRALFAQQRRSSTSRFDEALVDYQAAYDAEPPAFLFIAVLPNPATTSGRSSFAATRHWIRVTESSCAERLITEMDRLAAELPTVSAIGRNVAATFVALRPRQRPRRAAHGRFADAVCRRENRRHQRRRGRSIPGVVLGRRVAVVVAAGVATVPPSLRTIRASSLRPIDTRQTHRLDPARRFGGPTQQGDLRGRRAALGSYVWLA